MISVVYFVVGLVLVIGGAELVVRGAARFAAAVGISTLVIGLTVVAFGTSAPEFAVCVKAAVSGQGTIAIGNVIGSNIFNVLLILGVSSIVAPLIASLQLVRIDVPIMIVASIVVYLMALDGSFSRLDGCLLFAGLLAYLIFLYFLVRSGRGKSQQELEVPMGELPKRTLGYLLMNLGIMGMGLVLLTFGSNWLVEGASEIARMLGVSELIIGLTIIAAGTSLPEVVTSVIASLRGQRDIAIGNVVGSNIFNTLGVLGLASACAPGGIEVTPEIIGFDIPVMVAVAVVCLPIFFAGGMISRFEGGLLLAYYLFYSVYLFLSANDSDALPGYTAAMLYFVIPLTVVTLLVIVVRRGPGHLRNEKKRPGS